MEGLVRKYNNDELLSTSDLQKEVHNNIDRLNQRIKEGRIIKVADCLIHRKTKPTLRQFLEKCKFNNNEFVGLYVFFNKTEMDTQKIAMYTGISRDLTVRLKDHISGGDPSVASFAVLMARRSYKELDNYLSENAYKTPKTDDEIKAKITWKEVLKIKTKKIQEEEIREMYLTAIPISNYHVLHATEVFVASHFKCKFNSFKTH